MKSKLTPQDRTFHDQFSRYGRNAKEWLRKCALLLPEIEKREIWRKRGFGSIYEYAAKLAGMNRPSVDESLRVLRHAKDKPELLKVIEEKGIQSVRPVVAIATVETAAFWAAKAREMSKHTLETYVREYKKQGGEFSGEDSISNLGDQLKILPGEEMQSEKQAEIVNIAMKLAPEVAAELQKLKGSGDWNELMKELLELRAKKLESEKPRAVETKSRHIPNEIKAYVISKTRGQCAYPACTKPYKILHHTQRWALENIHDPDQLVPLCTAHERIAHHGLIENEEQSSEKWGVLKKPVWWDIKRRVDQKVIRYRLKPAAL